MDLYRSMTRQNSRSNSNSHSHSSSESRSRSRRNANDPFAGVYVYNPEAESSDEKEDQEEEEEEEEEEEPPLSSTADNHNIYSSSSSSSSSLSKLSSSSSCSYLISSQDENDHDHHDCERNDADENPSISQYYRQKDFENDMESDMENDIENNIESYHENERTEECIIDAESAWVSSQFQSHSPFNNTLRDGTSINKNNNDNNNDDAQDLTIHGEGRAVLATTVVDGERTAPGTTTAFDGLDTNANANTNASYRKHGWIGIGFTIVLTISVLVGIGIWQHNTPLQIHNQTNKSQQMENSTMGNSGNRKNVTTISSMVPTPSPSLVGTKESPPPFAWDSLGDYHESLLQTVLERVESFNNNNDNDSNNNNNNNNGNHLLDAYAWTTRGTPQFEALRFVAYQDGGLEAGGDMGYFNGVVVGGDTQLLLQRLSLLVLYFQTGGGFSWNTIASQPSTGNDENGNQNTNQIGNWNDRFRRRRRLFLPTGEDETDDEHDNENDYHFTDSEDWATPGVDECLWTGVICNEENYHVTELFLKEQGLVGRIPLEVWVWLPHLITVDLSKNTLRGSLPDALFWPNDNHATATAPATATLSGLVSKQAYLSELNHLDLSYNALEGSLPESLRGGRLLSLQVLNLSHNRLTGKLPTNYDKRILEQLFLSSNKLTGRLPFDEWFSEIEPRATTSSSNGVLDSKTTKNSLVLLDLDNNLLTGTIPNSLQHHQFLEFLSLQHNPLLSGSLPPIHVLAKLTNLRTLYLSDSGLEGSLTISLACLLGLPRLKHLSLAENHLTGSLPALDQVQSVAVSIANANANAEAETLIPLAPSALKILNLGNNGIVGTIPSELFADRLTNLRHLQLFGNHLEGSIPYASFDLETLTLFWVQNNPNLYGKMPCGDVAAFDFSPAPTGQNNLLGDPEDNPNYPNDYQADCWFPANIECSCCLRCF